MNEPLLTCARGADGRTVRGGADPFVRRQAEATAKVPQPPLAARPAPAG